MSSFLMRGKLDKGARRSWGNLKKMSIGTNLLFFLNKFFKKPVHPFNLEDEGIKTFAEWEFEQSQRIPLYYSPEFNLLEEIEGKTMLDIGAGGGGKSVFYALNGAKKVIGIDIEKGFIAQANEFARNKRAKNVEFLVQNAEETGFADNSFDICVMNDVFEHLANPEKVLSEVYRVLKKRGKIFINSPPYFHPYGAHLSDLIGVPYVHILFPEPVLINAYKELAKSTKSYEKRVNLRFGIINGEEHITYINRMTVKRFERIIKNKNPFKTKLYKLIPLKNSLRFMLKTPLREMFVRMVVYVGER
jgi:ubiquinone/menaquinone biosynthesis C-methylase UbiE